MRNVPTLKTYKNNINTFFYLTSMFYIAILIIAFIYNYEIFHSINGALQGAFAYPMLFFSAIADGIYILIIATIALQKRSENYVSFLLAFLITSILVHIIKYFFPIYRPSHLFGENNIFTIGKILTWSTFPSGHSTAIMVLARYLTFKQPQNFKFWTIVTFCFLVALSRVYIGAHYFFDVLAGVGIGFYISDFIFNRMHEKSKSIYYSIRKNNPKKKKNFLYAFMIILSIPYIINIAPQYKPLTLYLQISVVIADIYFLLKIFNTENKKKKEGTVV